MTHNPLIRSVIALVVLAALVLVLKILKAGVSKGTKASEYYLKKTIFTPAERSFLGVLESLEMAEYRIMAKVRLADIFGVKKGDGWQSAFNRISAKHIDFLLVRQSDGAPVLGIELDDSSHDEPDRKERDKFVDAVYASANLPLLHVSVRQTYEARAIHAQIVAALSRAG
jgi:hypothetical protein